MKLLVLALVVGVVAAALPDIALQPASVMAHCACDQAHHTGDCCEGKNGWTGTKASKHTPGRACSQMSSCSTCTLMDFCKWGGKSTGVAARCSDVNHITLEESATFDSQCDTNGKFKPAEVVDYDIHKTAFQKTALYHAESNTHYQQYQGDRVDTEMPHIEMGSGNFAGMFDGYAAPKGCVHSNEVAPVSDECAKFKKDDFAMIFPQWYR